MVGMARIISGSAVALCLLGCGHHFDYIGKWVGTRNVPTSSNPDRDVRHTLGKVQLEVKDGGKYILIDGGMPSEGTLDFQSQGASLVPTMIIGKPASRQSPDVVSQFAAVVTVDGKALKFQSPQGDVATLERKP